MAPKATAAARPTSRASTSSTAVPLSSKKRRASRAEEPEQEQEDAQSDSLGLSGDQPLQFGSDDEEDDGQVLGEDEDDDDDQQQEEEFPEIDQLESEDDEEEESSFDGSASDDEEEEEEDEAALLAELAAEDGDSDTGSDLSSLIRRHTTKPEEGDANSTPVTSWEQDPTLPGDYMRRAKVVKSEITGGDITKWDEEIDAGYGSDSSTEEVSLFGRRFSLSFGDSADGETRIPHA